MSAGSIVNTRANNILLQGGFAGGCIVTINSSGECLEQMEVAGYLTGLQAIAYPQFAVEMFHMVLHRVH